MATAKRSCGPGPDGTPKGTRPGLGGGTAEPWCGTLNGAPLFNDLKSYG